MISRIRAFSLADRVEHRRTRQRGVLRAWREVGPEGPGAVLVEFEDGRRRVLRFGGLEPIGREETKD